MNSSWKVSEVVEEADDCVVVWLESEEHERAEEEVVVEDVVVEELVALTEDVEV